MPVVGVIEIPDRCRRLRGRRSKVRCHVDEGELSRVRVLSECVAEALLDPLVTGLADDVLVGGDEDQRELLGGFTGFRICRKPISER